MHVLHREALCSTLGRGRGRTPRCLLERCPSTQRPYRPGISSTSPFSVSRRCSATSIRGTRDSLSSRFLAGFRSASSSWVCGTCWPCCCTSCSSSSRRTRPPRGGGGRCVALQRARDRLCDGIAAVMVRAARRAPRFGRGRRIFCFRSRCSAPSGLVRIPALRIRGVAGALSVPYQSHRAFPCRGGTAHRSRRPRRIGHWLAGCVRPRRTHRAAVTAGSASRSDSLGARACVGGCDRWGPPRAGDRPCPLDEGWTSRLLQRSHSAGHRHRPSPSYFFLGIRAGDCAARRRRGLAVCRRLEEGRPGRDSPAAAASAPGRRLCQPRPVSVRRLPSTSSTGRPCARGCCSTSARTGRQRAASGGAARAFISLVSPGSTAARSGRSASRSALPGEHVILDQDLASIRVTPEQRAVYDQAAGCYDKREGDSSSPVPCAGALLSQPARDP